jgi:hypothetical protein
MTQVAGEDYGRHREKIQQFTAALFKVREAFDIDAH